MIKALLTAMAVQVIAVLAVAALLAPPATAHTAMLRASPDRNAITGGSISFIDLEFLDPISDASVSVTYNGTPMTGQTTVTDGDVITFALDQPLTQPGRYQVSYEMISFDSDFTADGYFFTFDPTADQVARIEPSGPGGFSTTTLVVSVAGLAIVVGVLILFVLWIDNRRRDQLVRTTDTYSAEDYR